MHSGLDKWTQIEPYPDSNRYLSHHLTEIRPAQLRRSRYLTKVSILKNTVLRRSGCTCPDRGLILHETAQMNYKREKVATVAQSVVSSCEALMQEAAVLRPT